jgi:hypothetical protein
MSVTDDLLVNNRSEIAPIDEPFGDRRLLPAAHERLHVRDSRALLRWGVDDQDDGPPRRARLDLPRRVHLHGVAQRGHALPDARAGRGRDVRLRRHQRLGLLPVRLTQRHGRESGSVGYCSTWALAETAEDVSRPASATKPARSPAPTSTSGVLIWMNDRWMNSSRG